MPNDETVRGDARNEIREFLTSRRAKITPEQTGLPIYGGNRRVSGLRREEVALLARISVEYYTRIERGNVKGASDGVLDGIAHALKLDDAERRHLFDLVRAAGKTQPSRRRVRQQLVRPAVQRILDSMVDTPGFVLNGRLDILAANALGHALYAPLFDDPVQPANHARFLFLDSRSEGFWRDWDKAAADTVALLRTEAGKYPYDRTLSGLIGELSTRSERFRTLWATHDVRIHSAGVKKIHHPVVGDLDLPFEATPLAADTDQSLLIYTAEPGSASREALRLLASWSMSHDSADASLVHNR